MPAMVEKPGLRQLTAFFLCLLFSTAIGAAGYFSRIPPEIRTWMRLSLAVIFLAGLFIFRRERPAWQASLAFLAVSTGIFAAGLIGNRPLVWLQIAADDARGYTVAKIAEALPIVLVIFLVVLLSGRGLAGLRLNGGRPGWSILAGLAIGVLLFAYFLTQGGGQVFQADSLAGLLPTIGWVAVFSLVNSFMEELWFRGLFLSRFEWLLGPRLAFWLTALVFGLLHAFGSFTGTLGSLFLTLMTLVLGVAFGLIVRRTRSLWGAVAGHFFADFFMMLGYFASKSG